MGISPGEVDKLDFFWVEYLLEDLEEKIDAENKRFKKQEEEYQKQNQANKPPKTPRVGSTDYGGFKTPKMKMPQMKMPSMPTGKF
jgi:hypothetical protein